MPYAAIETWLYRAYERLRELARPDERPTIDGWERAPETLEDLVPPKEALPSVRSRHNLDLAERFPTRRCQELGLSYAAFVADLEAAIHAS